MSLQTTRDISLYISSVSASGERRISPSWTLWHLKTKLEPITGIPPSSQRLILKAPGRADTELLKPPDPNLNPNSNSSSDEDTIQLNHWALTPSCTIQVLDTRPPGMQPNFSLTDPSNAAVPKYEMPPEMYGQLTDSVLAWKKAQKLGRFDPDAPAAEAGRVAAMWNVVEEKGIVVGVRCRVGNGDGDGEDGDGDGGRRGLVRFVGEIDELPGVKGGAWVGVELDEPVGRNDGFVGGGQGKRMVFECGRKRGVFVRGEKVVVGDFPVLEIGLNEDMEEI